MATDTEASRRKHHRSASDEENEKSSKRHKHRHHRRHHRHRHSSNKNEEEIHHDHEESVPPVSRSRPEDDLEEGEILEEDESAMKEIDVELEKTEADGILSRIEEPITEHNSLVELSEVNLSLKDQAVNSSRNPKASEKEDYYLKKNINGENMIVCRNKYDDLEGSVEDCKGDFDQASLELHERKHKEMSSLSKEGIDQIKYLGNGKVDTDLSNLGTVKKPQSKRAEDDYRDFTSSMYHDRNIDGSDCRSRSRSNCHSRGEYHHGPVEEEAESKRSHHHGLDHFLQDEKSKPRYGFDDDYTEYSRGDKRHRSRNIEDRGRSKMEMDRDWSKAAEWEENEDRGLDKYKSDGIEEGRDRRREVERNRSKERKMDRDRRKEKEREMDRDRRLEKERGWSREREVDRDRRMEKERELDRDRRMERERELDRDRRMERERELDRDRRKERERELDRDRKMERERGWSRERELGRDRRMEKERGRSREREAIRDRRRERENITSRDKYVDGRRDRDRNDDKVEYSDRDWERVREMQKVRGRDKESERERDKRRRDDGNKSKDSYGNLEYGYVTTSTKLSRHDNESGQDGARISGIEKHGSFRRKNAFEGVEESDNGVEEEDDDNILADQEEEDLNRIKEESRRRREAILEKYKCQQLPKQEEPSSEEPGKDKDSGKDSSQSEAAAHAIPEMVDGVDDNVADSSFAVEKSPQRNGLAASEKISGAGGLGEGTPKGEGSDGKLFCDDIFGETPPAVHKLGKGDGLRIGRDGLHDNWDDADGYYNYRFGEELDGRYEITAAHGKGVFSTVVRAKNLKPGNGEPEEVAIKILRSNETMYKAGLEELVILKKIVGADPDDKRHCVRFLSSFKYRNHLCLVFESLHMNLREVLKKFGRNIGLKLTAVRAYAKQLFIALKHLRNCGVLHCDIKPDNMLVNEGKNVLKLCDFGNAMFAGKNEITPYLVSRFYRAPEIILGLPYDHPMDIWSVGCCLYELSTGKVLFPGPSNNDMLRLHMELKGPFPKKMLRKGAFTDQHFDQDLNFHASEEDPVTKKTIKRIIVNIKPKDIGSVIKGSPGEDPKMLANFKDLLDKIFVLDPDKRMTVSQALNHPFITGK